MNAALRAVHDGALRLLAALAGLAIAAMVLLIGADVLLRNSGLGNLPWLNEVVEYGLYVATFAAAPWVLRLGAHVRMDLALTLLPPRLARGLGRATELLGCLISLVLLYYALRATAAAYARGSLVIKTLVLPEWWLLAPMPLAFALLALEFALRARRGG